jgi:TolA-binding protein
MRQTSFGVLVVIVLLIAAAPPLSAANKEHQQLMADLRMLQEQSQLLQNLIGTVTEALKVVNTRLDQQAESTRKAFADQKLVIDNLTNDARVIREKLDDNNVRVGSLTQEVEAMRQSLQQISTRPSATGDPDPSSGGALSSGAQPAPAMTASPKQVFDAANADYMAGQYDLAVMGFGDFIKSFPKSEQAPDAQVLICAAYLNDNKSDKAVQACDLAIRTYPGGKATPEAYYRKGLALNNLKDAAGARAAWEYIIKNYPESDIRRLAQQGLDRMKKP